MKRSNIIILLIATFAATPVASEARVQTTSYVHCGDSANASNVSYKGPGRCSRVRNAVDVSIAEGYVLRIGKTSYPCAQTGKTGRGYVCVARRRHSGDPKSVRFSVESRD